MEVSSETSDNNTIRYQHICKTTLCSYCRQNDITMSDIWGGGGGGGGSAPLYMGGDRCQNSRPLFNDFGGGGGGGGVVKCCRLLHKTITTSIHINLYSSLYSIPLAIIIPESVSPNHMMAAAARGSVINALVPTQVVEAFHLTKWTRLYQRLSWLIARFY